MRNIPRSPASLISKLLFLTAVFILGWNKNASADINYNLLLNWSYQPPNVQQNLVRQVTNIRVVDGIPYSDPSLIDVYGLTTMYTIPGTTYVTHIGIDIKKGYEEALTHEVGHAISTINHSLWWWVYRPEFLDIWNRERFNCVPLMAQGVDDPKEYFANAYYLYIRFPQILKKVCPDTYNYMTVVMRYTN